MQILVAAVGLIFLLLLIGIYDFTRRIHIESKKQTKELRLIREQLSKEGE